MIDDNIVEIIPIDKGEFSDPTDKRKVSFRPFYEAIKRKFETLELIPTLNDYVMPNNAYWAAVPQLTQLPLFGWASIDDFKGNVLAVKEERKRSTVLMNHLMMRL